MGLVKRVRGLLGRYLDSKALRLQALSPTNRSAICGVRQNREFAPLQSTSLTVIEPRNNS